MEKKSNRIDGEIILDNLEGRYNDSIIELSDNIKLDLEEGDVIEIGNHEFSHYITNVMSLKYFITLLSQRPMFYTLIHSSTFTVGEKIKFFNIKDLIAYMIEYPNYKNKHKYLKQVRMWTNIEFHILAGEDIIIDNGNETFLRIKGSEVKIRDMIFHLNVEIQRLLVVSTIICYQDSFKVKIAYENGNVINITDSIKDV